jgi:two-component system sensor kinase FixL
VRRLRNFIASGELIREDVELEGVIARAADLALAAADARSSVELTISVGEQAKIVNVDPVQMGLVILNLVRNSIVALRNAPVRRIAITADLTGDAWSKFA